MQIYGFLIKAQLENTGLDLVGTPAGLIWFNTSDNKFRYRDNGAIRSVVNEDQAQTLTNKTLTGNIAASISPDGVESISLPVKSGTFLLNEDQFSFLDASHQVTPAAPSAGNLRIYSKDDNNLYKQDSEGNEVQIGTGGGGLDLYHTEDFEVNNSADLDSGNSATFLGGGVLAGTLSDLTGGAQFAGNRSLVYTQAAGSLNDYFASPVFDVPVKARGNKSGAKFFYSYTGDEGDIKPEIYDVTNGASLVSEVVTLKSFSGPKIFEVYVDVPSSCAQMRWGFAVKAVNDGAVLTVDDIQFNADALAPGEYYASTDWITYPLIVNGMPNATGVVEYKRDGNSATIRGRYDSSTGLTGDLWGINLPSGLTIGGEISSLYKIPNGRMIGDLNTNIDIFFLIAKGESATQVGYTDGTGSVNSNTGRAANFIGQPSTNYSFEFTVPIEEWSNVERGVSVRGSDSSNIANSNTFTTVFNSLGAVVSETHPGAMSAVGVTTGTWDINYSNILAGVAPSVVVKGLGGQNRDGQADPNNTLTTARVYTTVTTSAALESNFFSVTLTRQGDDYVKESERTVILPSGLQNPVAYLKEIQPNNTNAGTLTSGSYQTRNLNNLEQTSSFVSLASNQFTLQAGEYEVDGGSPAHFVNFHKCKIRNITDGVDALIGGSSRADDASNSVAMNTVSPIRGLIKITKETVFELQHRCTRTQAGSGLGAATSFGDDEVYAQLKITKRS